MKRLTNILSYLWLLLLMAVTACSDLEEEVGPMQGEEEVELTIQTEVSGMKGSTRAPMEITEKISTIVAIAFDGSGNLIKKVDAILSKQDHEKHSGTLKIKVPKRTRTIHFLGNYTKESIASITNLETLNNFTTTDATTMPTMRYWGMTTFDGSNINQPVTLYRNMAKLTLKKGEGFTANSCYIAGFVNRNLSGTIVPSGHAVGDTPTLPNDVSTYTHTADYSLGNVYYLFEHANVENSNPLYVIIEVAAKYYKVAFAAGDEYFPIIRNHEYTITIDGIDAMYAEATYDAAVKSQYPINDLVITNVPMTVTPPNPAEVQNESGLTFTVTVTIPEGITELNVPTHDAFDITPPNSLTPQNGKYTITEGNYEFTFTVKPDVEAGDKTISFSGRGKYKSATGSTTITLYDKTNVALAVAVVDEDPSNPSLTYGPNSVEDLQVNVTIPAGVTTLTFSSDYFTLDSASDLPAEGDDYLSASDNSYTVNHQGLESLTLPFRLRLKDDVSGTASFTFAGSGKTIYDTEVTTNNITLTSRDPDSEYIYWEGYLPLNQADNTAKITIPKTKLIVGRVLRIECDKTDDNQALALLNNWKQFTPDMQYSAEIVDVPLTDEFVNSINDNLIITGRGASGMIMKKISILPAVEIEAAPTTTSLNYSANSVSDLIVNVTIPAEVTTLNFSSEYFDVALISSRTKTENDESTRYITGSGPYTVNHQGGGELTLPFRLRLKSEKKEPTTTAGFTFSGTTTNENLAVIPADVNNITLTESGDGYVRWQGDVELSYAENARKIVLPYSWFSSVPAGSKLRVEYDILSTDGPIIQFSEVEGEKWDEPGFHFPELDLTMNNDKIGCNLSDIKSDTGYWIYGTNENSFTGAASFDLTLSKDVLTVMSNNVTTLWGIEDVVMAIQGGNVRLKSISVIPIEEVYSGTYEASWDNYLTIDGNFPKGTQITLNFTTSGGQLEVHDIDGNSFFPEGIDVSRRVANDDCFNVNSGETSISFTITSEIMAGFKLNGTGVTLTSIVAKYPDGSEEEEETVIFEYDFEDNSTNGLEIQFQEGAVGTYSATNGSLVLNVTDASDESWHAQVRYFMSIEKDATYKLTFKVKSTVAGDLSIILDNTGDWQSCGDFSTITLANKTDEWTEVETTATADATFTNNGRFVINFGHLEGTIYIDDLKLVRKNQ